MLIRPKIEPNRGERGFAMDVLSEVLGAVRLSAAFYFEVNASTPWVSVNPSMADIGSTVMPKAEHVIPFHLMMEGFCLGSALG